MVNNSNKGRGFTLIELLVVVAIMAVLVSILMPSLHNTKKLARVAACASNQHNTMVLLHMYGSDYGEWPTNEDLDGVNSAYYQYHTRQGKATTWMYQIEDTTDAYLNDVYRCAEALPSNNQRFGGIPADGFSWVWASRSGSGGGGSKDFNGNKIRNGDRNWFIFLGPLRIYPGSIRQEDLLWNNAWDPWGDSWGNSNAINPKGPIHRQLDRYFNPGGNNNSPNFFRRPMQNAVIIHCPNMVRMHGGPNWWNDWRAPHGNKPSTGRDRAVTDRDVPADARNYAFADGRVQYIRYNDNARMPVR